MSSEQVGEVTREEWTEKRAKELTAEAGMPVGMWQMFLHDAVREWLDTFDRGDQDER